LFANINKYQIDQYKFAGTLRITRYRDASNIKKPEFEKPGLAHQLLDACGLVFIIHLSGFSLCEKAFVSYLQDFFDS
jgi:hypothetical protein